MTLHPVDLAVIALYLCSTLAMGILMRKRALRRLDAYFLADRSVPWWMLGLSGCSSYIDIGGTMVLIGVMYYLGMKSMWVLHVVWGFFMMAFYMAYQAKYIRRSGVMTLAEWNVTRFGDTRQTEYVRFAVATFLLLMMISNLLYVAVGTGKFAEEFIPLERWQSTFIVFLVVGVYVTFGGFFGVILTDILQTILIILGAVVLTIMAFTVPEAASLSALKDPAWSSLLPDWSLWSGYLEKTPAAYHQFYPFGPVLLAGVGWLVFKLLAGPLVWDFTFFLTTKSPREASLAAGVWTVGHTVRWFIAIAFIVLGVHYLGPTADFDAEKIMPLVVKRFPVGLAGIFMAVLLAALMSTISAMINVTSSVILNDFLKRTIARNLPEQKLVRLGMVASAAAMITGFLLSFLYEHIVSAWEMLLYVMLTMVLVPGAMRWHWWRFGPAAFFWSMLASTGVVVAQKLLLPDVPLYTQIAFLMGASLGLTVLLTFLGKPADLETLVRFYARVRPFGFWKPVREEAVRRGLVPADDPMPRMDVINAFVACVFQFSLGVLPFYFFLKDWMNVMLWLALCLVAGTVLWFTWYRFLPLPDEV